MAATAFWNVFELKTNVFSHLNDDACISDLAHCARVHNTWTDPALNILYRGDPIPPITTETLKLQLGRNTRMTSAIAKAPFARRQQLASRAALLDLSMFNHWPLYCRMFHSFRFPRLKALVIDSEGELREYLTEEKEKNDSGWSWLPYTLEYLTVCEWARYKRPSLLTGSSLRDIANSCPGLKRVWFKAASFGFEHTDLARFSRRIWLREVRLDLGSQMNRVLTCDVLSALSHGGNLETLIIGRNESDGLSGGSWRAAHVEQLSMKETAAKPFASLRFLDVSLSCESVLWIPRCFSALTSLRLVLPGILVPLSTMTQLRVLEFRRDDDEVEPIVPARAYVVLSSLSQLQTLRLSGAFKPCYVPGSSYPCIGPVQTTTTGLIPMPLHLDPDEVEDQELHWPGDWFTEEDAAEMFAGLTNLEELSIDAGGRWFPDHLLQTISDFCPKLKTIEFINQISLRRLAGPKTPLFENLREMRVEHVESAGMYAQQTVEVLSQVAPKLQMLVNLCDGFREGGFENDVLAALRSLASRKVLSSRKINCSGRRSHNLLLEQNDKLVMERCYKKIPMTKTAMKRRNQGHVSRGGISNIVKL